MTVSLVCPECGTHFPNAADDDTCPACLTALVTIHEHKRLQLRTDELTGPQLAIDAIMRHNRGVRSD